MTLAELDRVCRDYRAACVSWARDLVPKRVAEDVAQEALVALARRAHDVPREAAGAFLREAVQRHARAAWRQLAAETPVETTPEQPGAEDVEVTLASAQASAALLAAVAALPESRRRPIVEVVCEGVPASEVARREGVPESTLHSRIEAGLADVRADLARQGAAEQRKSGFRSWCVAIVACLDPRALWRRIQVVRAATAVALGATGAVIAAMGGEPPHISPTPDEPLVRAVEVDTVRPITPLPAAERGQDAPAAPVRPRARHDASRHFAAVRFGR